jgi:transposase
MEDGAIDLHLRRSQFRVVQADGPLVKQGRFDTTRAELTRVFGDRPRLLIESSTESEWVAQHLEALGHEVIVADPNYAPMDGARRKVKTDGRDTAALTDACRLGIFDGRIACRRRRARDGSSCGSGDISCACGAAASVCCGRSCGKTGGDCGRGA